MTFDYKKYSLEKLQDWVHDALSSGEASPHEIYSAIREAVSEDYQYYKDHSARAYGLLELLSGHRPVADDDELYKAALEEREYYEGTEDHSYLEYKGSTVSSVKQDKVTKWQLPVEEDTNGEYFVSFPDDLLEAADLKEGDKVEWVDRNNGSYLLKKVNKTPSWVEGNKLSKYKTHDEMIADGWEMTDDGFWIKEN